VAGRASEYIRLHDVAGECTQVACLWRRAGVGPPGHQNVARFQIAVNQPALMRMVYSVADLHHDFQPLPRVQTVCFGIIQQRPATDKLHGKVGLRPGPRIRGTGFINLRNPGVLQPAQRLRLLIKSPHQYIVSSAVCAPAFRPCKVRPSELMSDRQGDVRIPGVRGQSSASGDFRGVVW
jgi:hypothetical protein